MEFAEVCEALERAGLIADAKGSIPSGLSIGGIADDSREIRAGHLFIAIPGENDDGHRFLPNAARAGAAAAIVERADPNAPVAQFRVRDARRAAALIAHVWNGRPSEKLRVVGVTGTNGKTTTASLIASILSVADGVPAGLFGTIERRVGTRSLPASTTTPGPLELQRLLAETLAAGSRSAVFEVSSHAIAQGRAAEVRFRAGVLTNIARDHIDYHGTPEAYRAVKASFFASLGPDAIVILNRDDPSAPLVEAAASRSRIVWYGLAAAPPDFRVDEARAASDGVRLTVADAGGTGRLFARIHGRHNLENLFAAAACARGLGVPWEAIETAAAAFVAPPGRLEEVPGDSPFRVFVDFAHTDGALRRMLESVREFAPGRVIAVFGCGGDRDRGKRPLMGRAAEDLADVVWVTSDNPRSEDPEAIIAEILEGMRDRSRIRVCPDREAAIAGAIAEAETGDIVVIAGKGHETCQIVGSERRPFDDRDVARRALAGRRAVA
ncbi:MAG: UDP-N-acetylmuramoyl-L-alanyl-D-glutamate--2,6-diaminopimelate ligase [Planctomycetes bacterium]|nr:UDP-N-acetylmuramoyl-L-alanyl-D-glutamate--2,6-diaminopimelate ligase [Planctomycetota bacterium]